MKYNKMYKPDEKIVENTVTPEPTPDDSVNTEPTPEPTEPVKTFGVVSNCQKLNVREKAYLGADVVCVIDANTEVEIVDEENSSDQFYKICTAEGVEGFCMKKYIEVK